MKSYKEIEKKYQPEEIAESYIFPNDLDLHKKTVIRNISELEKE